jgi:DNA-binding MarR family transcriptional regulator/GNAT superfamily N-acetyltransferase
MPARTSSKTHVDHVRRFNRFYTRLVGALDEAHLETPYSLAEGRVLFELAHRDRPTATVIGAELGLDAGYLSRLLRRLERRRLIKRTRSPADGRESHLALTAAGRVAFESLDTRASDAVARLLAPLDADGRRTLVSSMGTIGALLGAPPSDLPATGTIVLRPPRTSDFGWVVDRHGELYSREYGWNQRFVGVVARVVADYIESFDPARDGGWIAELNGERVGSVFVTKDPARPGVAKLRLLFVERSARGHGIGRRLVDECTRFARHAGYHTLSLWTNSVLTAARKLYADAGYALVKTEPNDMFGPALTAETWELSLQPKR